MERKHTHQKQLLEMIKAALAFIKEQGFLKNLTLENAAKEVRAICMHYLQPLEGLEGSGLADRYGNMTFSYGIQRTDRFSLAIKLFESVITETNRTVVMTVSLYDQRNSKHLFSMIGDASTGTIVWRDALRNEGCLLKNIGDPMPLILTSRIITALPLLVVGQEKEYPLIIKSIKKERLLFSYMREIAHPYQAIIPLINGEAGALFLPDSAGTLPHDINAMYGILEGYGFKIFSAVEEGKFNNPSLRPISNETFIYGRIIVHESNAVIFDKSMERWKSEHVSS